MVTAPQVFIATLLAGEANRAELPRATPVRIGRLSRRLGEPLFSAAASEGEMAAAGWACEICALADIAIRFPDRTLWLDFDRFLADAPFGLLKVARHLDPGFGADDVANMLAGPELGQYSKARRSRLSTPSAVTRSSAKPCVAMARRSNAGSPGSTLRGGPIQRSPEPARLRPLPGARSTSTVKRYGADGFFSQPLPTSGGGCFSRTAGGCGFPRSCPVLPAPPLRPGGKEARGRQRQEWRSR